MDNKQILQAYMVEHKLSDMQLGQILGYCRTSIYRMRTGSRDVTNRFISLLKNIPLPEHKQKNTPNRQEEGEKRAGKGIK